MNRLYHLKSRIKYLWLAKHRQGHGIHSPFAFHTLNYVVYEKKPFYCFDKLKTIRKNLLQQTDWIEISDLGSGDNRTQRVKSIVCKSAVSCREGELLFRLAHSIGAKHILELGTNLGVSAMYLASTNSNALVYTIEGDKNLIERAQENFNLYGFHNISPMLGNIDTCLDEVLNRTEKFDFVFFDANHTYDATKYYFSRCIDKLNDNAICVFHDIYHSEEMTRAWNEIKKHERVTLSIDIFKMGIAWINPNIPKQDYLIAF